MPLNIWEKKIWLIGQHQMLLDNKSSGEQLKLGGQFAFTDISADHEINKKVFLIFHIYLNNTRTHSKSMLSFLRKSCWQGYDANNSTQK